MRHSRRQSALGSVVVVAVAVVLAVCLPGHGQMRTIADIGGASGSDGGGGGGGCACFVPPTTTSTTSTTLFVRPPPPTTRAPATTRPPAPPTTPAPRLTTPPTPAPTLPPIAPLPATVPPAPPGAPTLTVDPVVGPYGSVTTATGGGFQPGSVVVLTWSSGLGTQLVPVNLFGGFVTGVLTFDHDLVGPRLLVATDQTSNAQAAYLVEAAPAQPHQLVGRR